MVDGDYGGSGRRLTGRRADGGILGAEGRPSRAVAIGDGAAAVAARGSDGGGDDMVETKLADTKVIGARVLPDLGRRL